MESWVLEGDSYSFLRSAPRNFNLRQREGPNRVEIFDITSIPSSRSEISETTCLCDIFGDDCESPSLSSSPASTSFLKREVDVHLSGEDVNDSSGSYHTAHSSEQLSDTSDSFEDSRDSLKQGTTESLLPETRKSSLTPTDLTSSNEITVDSYENHSPSPLLSTKVNDHDFSQTETREEPSLVENVHVDASIQRLSSSTSEFRDTEYINSIRTDSSETSETITTDLSPPDSPEIKAINTEHTETLPQHEDISTSPIPHQLQSAILDNQDHPVTYEPLNKSSQEIREITPSSKVSAEEDNVVSNPDEDEAKIYPSEILSNCSSPIEDVLQLPEAAQSDCSTDLTNLDTLVNGCPSTPPSTSPSISAFTPASSLTPSPLPMDTNTHSEPEPEAPLTPKDLARSSPETVASQQSAPLADDKAPEAPHELPQDSNIGPSPTPPTPDAENKTDINMSSFECQPSTVSPEVTETMVLPDPRRLSFISDTTESLASPELSEFSSLSRGSSMAAHSSEPSVVIYSPVGYTISPSPEFERRDFTAEPDTMLSTPEMIHPETDYSVTPTDFRGSVSSIDSKLCLTPESRSITSTPEIRQEFLTPDSIPTASSFELCSATPPKTSSCSSPEVRTVACSILSPNPSSPQIQGITYRVVSPQNQILVLPQYPDVEEMRCTKSPTSPTHPALENPKPITDSPSTLKLHQQNASTPENISRASSTSMRDATPSPETRDQRPSDTFIDQISVAEPCIALEPTSEELDLPSLVPEDGCPFPSQEELYKRCSPTLDECKDFATKAAEEILATEGPKELLSIEASGEIMKDTEAVPSESELPVIQVKNLEESTEKFESERLSDSAMHENLDSPNARPALMTMSTAPKAEGRNFLKGNDSSSGRGEMLVRGSGGSGKPPVHVPARPRESPNVFHCGNDREYDRQSCRNKGWSKERAIQGERTSGKGEENLVEGSYREEQVELSFRDRNRKGPVSHSAAPSSGDPKSGIPARCYFESPLTTRQQQSLLRAQGIQKENKSSTRRVQSAFQSKHSGAGRPPSGCTAETSSMGSELDEADHEVKWFTDVAFTSLSSPQGDYLDVYSSSHRSSNNVSQPSTVESPGTATWMSYADLRASALQENEDLQCHAPSFLPHGTLDPSRRFEMGSFECVDIAVESKEESKRGSKRTVPKRQIQLKRRNNEESKSAENAGNVMDSPFLQRRSREALMRQNSTPAVGHSEDMSHLSEGEAEIQTEKKMLQKSASLDEGSTKTKMATTIIKSILSKKMETKEPSRSEESSLSEDKMKHPEPLSVVSGISGNIDSLSSSIPSECSLSSEDFTSREDRSPYLMKKKSCAPKVPPKPIFKPNFIPPSCNNSPGIAALQDRMPEVDQMRPKMVDPFQSRTPPKKQIVLNSEKEAETNHSRERRDSHDSTNTPARNTTSAATRAASTQNRLANRDSENCATPESHKQQNGKKMFLSKKSEITLKPCTTKDKNKSSMKVSLSPAHSIDDSQLEETPECQTRLKPDRQTEVENEEDEKLNSKPVMHKVRDVRKLVKNTYNLSFKASNTTPPVEDPVEVPQKEKEMQNPHTLHIECKAINRKDKDNKVSSLKEETHHLDKSGMEVTTEINTDKNTTEIKAKTLPKVTIESKQKVTTVQVSDVDKFVSSNQCTTTSKPPENTEHSSDLEVPPRPTSRETSTLLFLQDDTSSANSCSQKPGSPALPHGKSMSGSHSVSMLRKEKGMQADIGVCEVLNEGISASPKHINRLEVPLQTCLSEETSNESQKDKKVNAPCEPKKSTDDTLQATQCVSLIRSSPKPKEPRVSPSGTLADHTGNQAHAALVQPLKEEEKMTTPATSVPCKISPPLITPNKAEVRSFSSSISNKSNAVTTSKEIELPIQVRSVSSDRPKPSVPAKPSYKQPFPEMRSTSSDLPKTDIPPMSSIFKQQTHLKSDVKKSEASSVAVAQKEQSIEAVSSTTRKLAVSAVSSYKPPSSTATTGSNSDFEQKPKSPLVATTARPQISITSGKNSVTNNQQQQDVTASEDHAVAVSASSCVSSHPVLPVASQSHTYIQPSQAASSVTSYQLLKDDFHVHESDDPPSYDERESFSPLLLSDLPPRRLNRYHPTNKPAPCSCTTSSQSHPGHPYPGPKNRTPPASRASPGQVISYPSAPPKAQVRPHQTRQDGQPLNYPSVSPKTSIPPAPAMIQPLHHSYPCPAPATHSYGDEQPTSSTHMQMERHPANRRSPQDASGAAYREHSRSPSMAMDPRSQFFGSHDLPPAFSHDYGSDGPGGGNVLYPENASGLGYGQGPRRVLLDPETGKYFYIEVPMQPLRKMLFDPEIGQYVEVLIPQQAMSHSGMYPPTAAPYPSLHGAGLYAPQYLPYSAPPHPQSAQQPRHSETSVSTTLHQTSMGYGGSAGQPPKSEAKSHPSLDQSYLESMYYIPTGMNASPNSTPSDCYHKPSPNMPASGGRRA